MRKAGPSLQNRSYSKEWVCGLAFPFICGLVSSQEMRQTNYWNCYVSTKPSRPSEGLRLQGHRMKAGRGAGVAGAGARSALCGWRGRGRGLPCGGRALLQGQRRCLSPGVRGPRAQISRLAGPLSAAGSVVRKRGGAERSPRELAQVAPAASCGPLSGGLGSSLVAPGSGPGFPTRA